MSALSPLFVPAATILKLLTMARFQDTVELRTHNIISGIMFLLLWCKKYSHIYIFFKKSDFVHKYPIPKLTMLIEFVRTYGSACTVFL